MVELQADSGRLGICIGLAYIEEILFTQTGQFAV